MLNQRNCALRQAVLLMLAAVVVSISATACGAIPADRLAKTATAGPLATRPVVTLALAPPAANTAARAADTETRIPQPAASAGPEPTWTAIVKATAEPTVTAAPIATATPGRVMVQPTRPSPTIAPVAAAPTPIVSGSEIVIQTDRRATTYRVAQITLPTYPYAAFLKQVVDPDRVDYPVMTLDRAAYEASNPQPAPKTYRLLVLENPYLRLGILPDLGGRIIECTFKPTGANEFYANQVIKPTAWGPPSGPYPAGAAWWTAAGGLEWGFPVEEHGYEFGTVWGFDHAAQPDGGVMITVFTKTGPQAPYAVVDIILPPDTASFVIRPRIVNPLGSPFRFKWWANAMLAPGKANTVSPDLRFIFPASEVTIHSTGDASLPAAGQVMSWPVVNGRDLSWLGAWQNYLGVFARPGTAGHFAGVYDTAADEGMVRVQPDGTAKGLKLFAPRGSDGLDPALWTDDGSTYVELHSGLAATFDDWYELGPGQEVTWSETWYPVAGIGGVTFAGSSIALSLIPSSGGLRVGVFPTTALTGRLAVTLPGAEPLVLDVQLSPEQPFVRELVLPEGAPAQGQVAVSLVDSQGAAVFEWQGAAQLR